MRVVAETTSKDGHLRLSIRFKPEWEEYVVRYQLDGDFDTDKFYYTSDKDDAIDTMAEMMREYERGK